MNRSHPLPVNMPDLSMSESIRDILEYHFKISCVSKASVIGTLVLYKQDVHYHENDFVLFNHS
jgi:hypothetical protein